MKLALVLEIAIVLCGTTTAAQAETKRVRVALSSIPFQKEPVDIDPKTAVLPDGAREGSPVPKSWKLGRNDMFGDSSSQCTDGRRASVASSTALETSTQKIWEANGKVFFDRAYVKIEEGKIHVTAAHRSSVVYVADGAWAYRKADAVVIVSALDIGVFSRAVFFGCSMEERSVPLPAGAVKMTSSPREVDDVVSQIAAETTVRKTVTFPPWKGMELEMLASVSKASADPEPMLNLVIRRP